MNKLAILSAAVAVAAEAFYLMQPKTDHNSAAPTALLAMGAMVSVSIPAQFSEQEHIGNRAY